MLLKQDTDTPEDFQSGSTFSTNELNSGTDEMGEHVAGRKAPELRGVGETEHTDLAGNVLSQVPHDQHSSTGDTFQKSSTTYCVSPHTLRMNEMARKVSNAISSSIR